MSRQPDRCVLLVRYFLLLTFLVFARFASDARGQSISVDPPKPLDTTPVTLTVAEFCASGCAFDCFAVGGWVGLRHYHVDWETAVNGSPVCPTICIKLVQEFELDILPVGDYTVTVDECRYVDPSLSCSLFTPLRCVSAETTFHVYSVCDVDLDADVDESDFFEFMACSRGPNNELDHECTSLDFDNDDHVDMRDFAVLQAAFTG